MGGSTREIRRRVKAVKNIRQITRAMELVSAAKMQRAVTAVQQSRRYATLAWETLQAVAKKIDARHHPLLERRQCHRVLILLITSNRGLAGGFNSKVNEAARAYIARAKIEIPNVGIDLVTIGKKGREYMQKLGMNIVADFDFGDRASASEMSAVASVILDDYEAKKYDSVVMIYPHFVSMINQEPRVHELLPLANVGTSPFESDDTGEYLFEPNPAGVLAHLVPRLLEAQLYQVLVESRAAEQSARMVAMRNATEAAGDLIDDLTLTYNQLRQSGITQELAEISAGRLALGV